MGFGDHVIGMLSAVIAVEYMDHAMENRHRGIKRCMLFGGWCVIYFAVMVVLNKVLGFEGVLGIAYGIVLVLYGLAALGGSLFHLIILGGAWVFIAMISTFVTMEAIALMTQMGLGDLRGLLEQDSGLWVCASLAAAVLKFSLGRIILSIYKRDESLGRAEDGATAAVFFILFLVVTWIFQMEMGEITYGKRESLSLLVLGGILAIILLMGVFYKRMEAYRRVQREEMYQKKYLEMQKEQIRDLYRACREVNHFRHDATGRLEVIHGLLKKGKCHEAMECLKEMGAELGKCEELPQDTGNEGLNAALMKAAQECKEEGIAFHYVIFGKPERIDAMDMGRLLFGLLNNGIEACRRMTGDQGIRAVELVVRELDEMTELQIDNSIEESVLTHNFELRSQKPERLRHGFGMENIHSLIDKYHGEYICREEEGRFIQKIVLRS